MTLTENDPFKHLQVRTFNVSCEEKLKSIKFTQTGTNTSDNNFFEINDSIIFPNDKELLLSFRDRGEYIFDGSINMLE